MIRILTLLFVTTLLAGCQTAPSVTTASFPSQAEQFEHWQLRGRIGYDNGKEGGSAALVWRQVASEQGSLDLSGPMGFGSAHIRYAPDGAHLDTGKQQVAAPSATELAWRVTGLALPIPALVWWVRGLPWPDAEVDNSTHDGQGLLTTLEQAGWQLGFDRYQLHGQLWLPGRIKAHQGDSRFTLLVQDWQALP